MCDVVFKVVNLFFFCFCFFVFLFFFAFSCFLCVWGDFLFNPDFCDVVRIVFALSSLAILSQREYEIASCSINSIVDIVQESLF